MRQEKAHKENRKHPRTSKRIQFKLKTHDSDIVAETTDLSCIGVCCQVNKPITFMSHLMISFTLADSEEGEDASQVECGGVVVRVEKDLKQKANHSVYNVAIFFHEIEESEKAKIAKFLAWHGSHQ
ncbi:MAG: PilZ domain-containing protein [Planctomycetota bacterium]